MLPTFLYILTCTRYLAQQTAVSRTVAAAALLDDEDIMGMNSMDSDAIKTVAQHPRFLLPCIHCLLCVPSVLRACYHATYIRGLSIPHSPARGGEL